MTTLQIIPIIRISGFGLQTKEFLKMNDYELTVLVKTTIGEKDLDKEIKSLQNLLDKLGAKITAKKDAVKQQLAYEIKKLREANYVYVEFSAPSEVPAQLENKLKINENVIRYLLVRK